MYSYHSEWPSYPTFHSSSGRRCDGSLFTYAAWFDWLDDLPNSRTATVIMARSVFFTARNSARDPTRPASFQCTTTNTVRVLLASWARPSPSYTHTPPLELPSKTRAQFRTKALTASPRFSVCETQPGNVPSFLHPVVRRRLHGSELLPRRPDADPLLRDRWGIPGRQQC